MILLTPNNCCVSLRFDDTSPPTSINIKCNCALPVARWKKVGVRVPPRLPRGKRKEIYRVTLWHVSECCLVMFKQSMWDGESTGDVFFVDIPAFLPAILCIEILPLSNISLQFINLAFSVLMQVLLYPQHRQAFKLIGHPVLAKRESERGKHETFPAGPAWTDGRGQTEGGTDTLPPLLSLTSMTLYLFQFMVQVHIMVHPHTVVSYFCNSASFRLIKLCYHSPPRDPLSSSLLFGEERDDSVWCSVECTGNH